MISAQTSHKSEQRHETAQSAIRNVVIAVVISKLLSHHTFMITPLHKVQNTYSSLRYHAFLQKSGIEKFHTMIQNLSNMVVKILQVRRLSTSKPRHVI